MTDFSSDLKLNQTKLSLLEWSKWLVYFVSAVECWIISQDVINNSNKWRYIIVNWSYFLVNLFDVEKVWEVNFSVWKVNEPCI